MERRVAAIEAAISPEDKSLRVVVVNSGESVAHAKERLGATGTAEHVIVVTFSDAAGSTQTAAGDVP
ncbi:MAG TPA: hypothetical protein VHM00_10505 [Caldimonas sp.]|jgi:hypothetical protein|nr:hypothetical protein [Caldimonas sp.]HEX2541500.1 hypothetical protein [Caldimonas sp.]